MNQPVISDASSCLIRSSTRYLYHSWRPSCRSFASTAIERHSDAKDRVRHQKAPYKPMVREHLPAFSHRSIQYESSTSSETHSWHVQSSNTMSILWCVITHLQASGECCWVHNQLDLPDYSMALGFMPDSLHNRHPQLSHRVFCVGTVRNQVCWYRPPFCLPY